MTVIAFNKKKKKKKKELRAIKPLAKETDATFKRISSSLITRECAVCSLGILNR